MAKIKINGQDYDTDHLSEDIKSQLTSIRMADVEIKRLNVQLLLAQTARNAFAKGLEERLPKNG
jgi:hypothetical protein